MWKRITETYFNPFLSVEDQWVYNTRASNEMNPICFGASNGSPLFPKLDRKPASKIFKTGELDTLRTWATKNYLENKLKAESRTLKVSR